MEADLSKLKNAITPKIRGIKVKIAAMYLINLARELDMQAIIIAPKAGRKIINERMLKFNLLPPTSNSYST
jgi:predicted  nucleic acid-binding Zn-ribbon protein